MRAISWHHEWNFLSSRAACPSANANYGRHRVRLEVGYLHLIRLSPANQPSQAPSNVRHIIKRIVFIVVAASMHRHGHLGTRSSEAPFVTRKGQTKYAFLPIFRLCFRLCCWPARLGVCMAHTRRRTAVSFNCPILTSASSTIHVISWDSSQAYLENI